MWIVGTLSGRSEGVFLFEIYTAGKAGLDLSRKFQTSPPMGTWNSGLTNSKFVAKLELELSKIQVLWHSCGSESTQNRALRDRFHEGRAVQGICSRCPAAATSDRDGSAAGAASWRSPTGVGKAGWDRQPAASPGTIPLRLG